MAGCLPDDETQHLQADLSEGRRAASLASNREGTGVWLRSRKPAVPGLGVLLLLGVGAGALIRATQISPALKEARAVLAAASSCSKILVTDRHP